MTATTLQYVKNIFETEGSRITFHKGQRLPLDTTYLASILYIQQGAIQLTQETMGGKELTTRICGANSIIGNTALFAEIQFPSSCATALQNSTAFVLTKTSLEERLTLDPAIMMEYMQWLQLENVKHQSMLRDLVLHGKKGALYSTLIRLANTYGIKQHDAIMIDLALTNTDLANLCGTSREMVNRMLNELKNYHILTFTKGQIIIYELEALKKAVDCENCPLAICRID